VQAVRGMTWAELLVAAPDGAENIAGPWHPGAASSLAVAYGLAQFRRPIAEAICEHFRATKPGVRYSRSVPGPSRLGLEIGCGSAPSVLRQIRKDWPVHRLVRS
jgi:hypothetical protein